MNVIGYIRVSTAGQAKDGYNLSNQQEIESYCQQQGWNLLHVFSDEGISGAKVEKQAFDVQRVSELKELFPTWSLSELAYQLQVESIGEHQAII